MSEGTSIYGFMDVARQGERRGAIDVLRAGDKTGVEARCDTYTAYLHRYSRQSFLDSCLGSGPARHSEKQQGFLTCWRPARRPSSRLGASNGAQLEEMPPRGQASRHPDKRRKDMLHNM